MDDLEDNSPPKEKPKGPLYKTLNLILWPPFVIILGLYYFIKVTSQAFEEIVEFLFEDLID